MSCSTAPGTAVAAVSGAAVLVVPAAAAGALRGGGRGVVAMTRISGSLTALGSALVFEFCCATAMRGAINVATEAAKMVLKHRVRCPNGNLAVEAGDPPIEAPHNTGDCAIC